MATGHILPLGNTLLWHCDVSMPAPQDELHGGGSIELKPKWFYWREGAWVYTSLGSCLLLLSTGDQQVPSKGHRMDILDWIIRRQHSFLAPPVVQENNKPWTKLKTSGRDCVPAQTLFLENRNLNFIEFHTSQSRMISVI